MSPAEILTLREQLGLTQTELGTLLGVHPMTVSKWERGVLPGPDDRARPWLTALGIYRDNPGQRGAHELSAMLHNHGLLRTWAWVLGPLLGRPGVLP